MEENEKEFARKWFKLGYNDCIKYFLIAKPDKEGRIDYPANIEEKFEEWYINLEAMELNRKEILDRSKRPK